MIYEKKYLDKLKGAGKISRLAKKIIVYTKIKKYKYENVLDYGCGDLSFLRYVKSLKKEINVTGLDVNPAVKELCEKNNINYVSKISEYMEGEFDLIMCDNVLEHINDWKGTISQLSQVLSSDGVIIAGVPGLTGYSHDDTHQNFITDYDIIRTSTNLELKIIDRFFYPINIGVIARVMQVFSRHVIFYYIISKRKV